MEAYFSACFLVCWQASACFFPTSVYVWDYFPYLKNITLHFCTDGSVLSFCMFKKFDSLAIVSTFTLFWYLPSFPRFKLTLLFYRQLWYLKNFHYSSAGSQFNFQNSLRRIMHAHTLPSSSELLFFFPLKTDIWNKIIFDFQHCCSVSQELKLLLLRLWGRTVDCLVCLGCRLLRVRSCKEDAEGRVQMLSCMHNYSADSFLGGIRRPYIFCKI